MSEETPTPATVLERQELTKQINTDAKVAELRAKAAAGAAAKIVSPIVKPAAAKVLTTEDIGNNLLAIPSLLETSEDEYEHVIAHGAPGMGKTLAACLLSEFYHILYFDGDKGLRSALTNLPEEMQKRIHPIRIPDNTANPIFWNIMLKIITGRETTICVTHGIISPCPLCNRSTPQGAYVTLALNKIPKNWIAVMDSQTQFVASAIAAINKKATNGADTNDEFKFEYDHWGVLKNICEKFGTYVQDLRCHFISLAHETLAKTEDNTTSKIVPVGGSDNTSRNFGKYFSTIINCKIVNHKHTYITSSTYHPQIQTKSRANVILEKEPIPSFLHIFRQDAKVLLKGSWNEWFFSDRKLPQPKPKNILEL